jgi:hypothetical protein
MQIVDRAPSFEAGLRALALPSGSGTGLSRCARRDPLKAASFRT